MGSEKTAQRILKDWYWPNCYDEVDRWCRHCDLCRGEKGPSGISAWTRTEVYSRPFRVVQIDTVSCLPANKRLPVHGYKYILSAICCFSRFVWLIPLASDSGEDVGRALLEKVLIDLAMFPTVIRSDRGPCFVGSVVQCINSCLLYTSPSPRDRG